MMRMTSLGVRFERYLAIAAVPAAGMSGHALADIIHYGGPTIRVERTQQSGTAGDGGSRHFGSASLGLPSSFGGEYANAVNNSISATLSSDFAFAGAVMRNGMLSNGGLSNLAFAVCGSSSNGQLGGLAGSFFGGSPMAGCNLLNIFQAGDQIDSQIGDFGAGGMVALSVSAMATAFGEVIIDESAAVGEWAVVGVDESRGFVGWSFDTTEGMAYGWMDVGWDGEILSIYDWAFNTDGSIAAGQTSQSTAVPGGTGLALLAMGAAGMRRRRKQSA